MGGTWITRFENCLFSDQECIFKFILSKSEEFTNSDLYFDITVPRWDVETIMNIKRL